MTNESLKSRLKSLKKNKFFDGLVIKRGIEKETSLDIPQTGMVSNVDGVHPNRGMVDAADADGHDRHRLNVTARKSTSMI